MKAYKEGKELEDIEVKFGLTALRQRILSM